MSAPTPLLDFFRRGEIARDVKMLAATGALAPRAHEQIQILLLLLDDADGDIRAAAEQTLAGIPLDGLRSFLARSDAPAGVREFFAARGILPAEAAAVSAEDPLIETADTGGDMTDSADGVDPESSAESEEARASLIQQLAKMNFTERLRAAVKGSKEMRAVLIRDPNKMIAASVLSSPKVSEQEIASFAKMANVSEDVLRIIGSNRSWTKNYGVMVGLTRNPKTPLAMSINFLSRLNDRDVQTVSLDRNVPEQLRAAARRKVAASRS